MDKETAIAELRRGWGDSYESRVATARTVYDRLPEETKKRIDPNGVYHIRTLAAMGSEAYTNPKHPEHAQASSEANALYVELYSNDIPLI